LRVEASFFVASSGERRCRKASAARLHGGTLTKFCLWSVCPRLLDAVFAILLAVLCGWSATASGASAQEPANKPSTLTTAYAAHNLSSKEAVRGYPIHLRAVITFFDPMIVNDGRAGIFVHDSTGSIFLFLTPGLFDSLPPGTLIDLRGVSAPGWYAPVIAQPQIKVIGYSGLPKNPHRPGYARLLSGAEDAQWVEVDGVVHSVVEEGNNINLQLTMDDGPIMVLMIREAGAAYSSLVDAKIRIRGNVGALFDVKLIHRIGIRLYCPNLSAVQVLRAPPIDPFKLPTLPIDKLLRWDQSSLLAHRVHMQGRVTLQWPGSSVCIQDAAHGICAQTGQNERLRNGEMIDIAGFIRAEGNAPMLYDAVFRNAGSSADLQVEAAPVTADEIMAGGHSSQLIHIDGQLLSRDLSSSDTTLLINSGKFIFKAILPQSLSGPESKAWENGSFLRITGISSVQIDAQRSELGLGTPVPLTFRVMLRSPADVVVLKRPSWWTPSHALIVLALALGGTLVVLVWVVLLRKRLRESEERFRHMALHDALTGLATRPLFQDRLDVGVEAALRHHTGLALLMVDLDDFKQTNDKYGHPAGDEVLRVTAARLVNAVRVSDTVARIGGDEFLVLLSDLNDPLMAENIAAKIVKSLAVPVLFSGHEVPVTVSVGVCALEEEELDQAILLKRADEALYQAKTKGRNCYVVFMPELPRVPVLDPS